ncbi:hypothetical protein KZZ08_10580 [Roseovarius mucosus]|uniref:hypothetical protein n=1 Tax=Roseovarius mucosus TaxID=215743 RepID=UPI001C5D9B56|nr:hypothetical protein [Roseovarius mucosus]MBW4974067.1 hypothetical protein [Roseovarius mucosus]
MTAVISPSKRTCKSRLLPLAVLSAMVATPALAFNLKLTIDPQEVRVDHPYQIIGLAPGASYAEIAAAASERGIPLYEQRGVMTINHPDAKIGLDVAYGFQTTGYDNPYLYQNETEYEFMQGFLSTDATGNVAVSVSRNLGIPLPKAPSLEAVRKQVIDQFGEPTLVDKDLGFHRAIWIHDVDGAKIAPGTIDAMPENCGGHAQFTLVAPATVETGCSVTYEVAFKQMQSHTLIRFTIVDYLLRDADRVEAARQINAEIAGIGDDEASDLDL